MTIIIEADSTFDKEALTKILDCCGEQPQSIEYMINKTCSCLLSPYSSESPVSTCCQRAVRYARMAFGLWDKGLRDSMFLLELTSHRLVVVSPVSSSFLYEVFRPELIVHIGGMPP